MNRQSGIQQADKDHGNGSELFTVDLEDEGSPNLAQGLTVLADAIGEYLSVNSFFCSACVSLLASPERLDRDIAVGAQQTVASIRARAEEIKAKIEMLRSQIPAERA